MFIQLTTQKNMITPTLPKMLLFLLLLTFVIGLSDEFEPKPDVYGDSIKDEKEFEQEVIFVFNHYDSDHNGIVSE